jgi:alkyl hydroperoxide reductase subunit AhpC
VQLRERQDEMERLGLQVAVVTFESEPIAKKYIDQTRLPWPVLMDRRRELYRAYGMGRGAVSRILGPGSWWAYLKLLFRGHRLQAPTDDVYQLGGDVLIDPSGIVRLHYVSRTPVDRPDVVNVLALVRNS